MRVWKDVGDYGTRSGGYDRGDHGEEPGGSHAFELGVVDRHTSVKVSHVGPLRRGAGALKDAHYEGKVEARCH